MDVLIDAVYHHQSQPSQSSPTQTSVYPNSLNATASTPQSRPSISSQTLSQSGPPHRCHLCARTYERADHLNRHLKSHENARPHKCSRCTKSFNRADLLNRHEASHDRHAHGDARPRIERGERVATACQACVSSKSKCQDQKPCLRCVKRGVDCQGGGGSRDSNIQSPLGQQSAISNVNGQDIGGTPDFQRSYSTTKSRFSDDFVSHATGLHPPTSMAQQQSPGMAQRDIHASGSGYYNENSISTANNFFGDSFQDFAYLPDNSQFSQGLGFMPRDSYFSQDLDFGMWDIDLDSVELAYQSNSTKVEEGNNLQADSPRNTQKDVSKRFAAFERSPWLWTPTQKDQALNDQENLNLDEESIPSVLTPASPAASMDDFASCCIDSRTRDHLLGLLFSIRKPPAQVPSFPSLALLNSIIQVYFVQESFRVDNIIHSATFDSKKALPHLLIAVVAAGSTLISTPAIWKLGLALQEVVRHTVAEFWEQNNSRTRNLQAIQAFMIGLDIGLWSGFKRKMEIAESFAQPVIIMLRRAGAFAAPGNPSIFVPERNDSDGVLESKWRKWVERESWKRLAPLNLISMFCKANCSRLALHLFIHDIHASIGLQKPPLISFTELKFALPASRELWLAKSGSVWRDRYLSSSAPSDAIGTSFTDAMQTPDLLTHFSTHIDVHFSAITLLHGYWGQIWSLLESKKFYPPSKATHRLCLLTSHTELYRDLVAFSNLLPPLTRNSAEATLIAEMLMMILHASPEDLQRFAGKFGEDEARKASIEFTEWSKVVESRIAVWHAGQIFRAANRLGQAQIRGFNAIAVYYASLTLWIYGLMTSISLPPSSSNSRLPKERIVLNGAESSSTRSWRGSDEGTPGLIVTSSDGRNEQFVPVQATDKILQLARNVYKNNFPDGDAGSDGSVPPLVENLGNLLRDLGSLPGSRVSRAPSESAG